MGSPQSDSLSSSLQTALDGAPEINNQHSTVHRCPALRACPGCHSLVSHIQKGCPTVWCPECKCSFCFRCLQVGYCGYRNPQCPIQGRQRLQSKGSSQPQR